MSYKIQVKTLQGSMLTFTVENYSILEGDLIEFTDIVTGKTKRFHTSQVQIDVLGGDSNDKP